MAKEKNLGRRRFLKLAMAALYVGLLLAIGSCDELSLHQGKRIKALIVTGQSNKWHDWTISSPFFKELLEETGLFEAAIVVSPAKAKGAGEVEMEKFCPNFADYNVVILDYDGDDWAETAKKEFVKYMKDGGGLVVVHASDNPFAKWKEFNEIIGLGGWGGRNEKDGPMVRWGNGKVVYDFSPGLAGDHGPQHEFVVTNRNTTHPITAGLPKEWMHGKDEMYSKLRGPAINLTVLATAYSDPSLKKGTGENEPILFTVRYGKGRTFHTVLGHIGPKDEKTIPALDCVGFITTFQRGAEWAATGKVTQKVPKDFPTVEKVSLRPSRKVQRIK